MIKKNYKGRCEKKTLTKCKEVCRLYNRIQKVYADRLETDGEIKEFTCNVLLDHLEVGEYSTDFVCWKTDGTLRVRECVERKQLTWPSVIKLLDASRDYWTRRGVEDWGVVIAKQSDTGDT